VLDGAHNAASAEVLRTAIGSAFASSACSWSRLSEGKDARGVVGPVFFGLGRVFDPFAARTLGRAVDLEPLVRAAAPRAQVSVHADVSAALEAALAFGTHRRPGAGDGIAISGRRGSGVVAPLASVIVPTLNGAHLLEACLDSLMRQSYARLEVIVADGASTDQTAALLARAYPSVRLLQLRRNAGFSGNVNAGLRASG